MPRRQAIAVVGAGPKGTYALDSLAKELDDRPGVEVDVHIFEPHGVPGAGPVYDTEQPSYLRLNYANRHVDMWRRPSPRPTFMQWLDVHHPHLADPDDSAPRAVVGEYLNAGFEQIEHRLRQHGSVRRHPHSVRTVRRQDDAWAITGDDARTTATDAVLVTTGHTSRAQPVTGLEGAQYITSVYPIDQSGIDQIAPGSVVAVRGLGLTAIDAALALTEGRGGRFDCATSPIPTYRPSGHEPATILCYSRTGRTMTPKPHPACDAELSVATARRVAAALRDAPDPVLTLEMLLDDRVSEVRAGRCGQFGRDAALGATWRDVYPSIVEAAASHRFDDHWTSFARLAEGMERMAFGPPASNAARFAALVEAGIVDLQLASNPHIVRSSDGFFLRGNSVERHADTLVNAVLAPPGIGSEPSPLFAGLLRDGHVRLTSHADGIEVDRNGGAIGVDGALTPQLATIGRMTHGSTIGNDTLSRSLHDTPQRWARSCVADLASRALTLRVHV